MPGGIPQLDLNLFADVNLRDPFPAYRHLRDAGAIVRLPYPDVYVLSRYDDVLQALRSPDALVSGQGVGFSAAFNVPRGKNVMQSDGAIHRRLRAAIVRPLAPARLKAVRSGLKVLTAARVAALDGAGAFDAMPSLAAHLPVEAVSHLVGLPPEGRTRMLAWASAAFNLVGPEEKETDLRDLAEARSYMAGLHVDDIPAGSWAGELFELARAGRITVEDALAAVSAYVLPSLDTTIQATGHLLWNLAESPDQWALLKTRPELARSAVAESLRHSSVIRWFARVAAQEYVVGGFAIPVGARVMLIYGSANRDERHYRDPDRFDIQRDARDHLAWGAGPHLCAGLHLASLEMQVLLEALIERGVTLHAGRPVRSVNRGLYGFVSLPYRISTRDAHDPPLPVAPCAA